MFLGILKIMKTMSLWLNNKYNSFKNDTASLANALDLEINKITINLIVLYQLICLFRL